LEFSGDLVLSGTVLLGDGANAAGAQIDVFAVDGGSQRAHSSAGRAPDNFSGNSARVAQDGSFRVTGLSAGEYRVRVTLEGQPPLEVSVPLGPKLAPLALRFAEGASLAVALAPLAASAPGRVVLLDSSDDGGHRASAISDEQGVARFRALPAGTYRV